MLANRRKIAVAAVMIAAIVFFVFVPAVGANNGNGRGNGNGNGKPSDPQLTSDGGASLTQLAADGSTVLGTQQLNGVQPGVTYNGASSPLTAVTPMYARCTTLTVWVNEYSGIFNQKLGTFYHVVNWCYNGSYLTSISVGCHSEVNGTYIQDHGCSGYGWYYTWGGNSRGGHYSFRQANWGNCVLYYGCFKNIYPQSEIWVAANGDWSYRWHS